MLDFAIKDCVLAMIAEGRRAQTLRELRDALRDIHPGCIYHHFWGTLLRPQFSDREFNNDFATWCHHGLHDDALAERLAVIDPAHFVALEELRHELIEVIDERLDETETVLFARADRQFHFARSVIVVFDTHKRLSQPQELVEAVPQMSVGSIFYHFIDARQRNPVSVDDFSAWRVGLGPVYAAVGESVAEVDPYFESLFVIRQRLTEVFSQHLSRPSQEKASRRLEEQMA